MSQLMESVFGPMGPLAQAFVALVIVVVVIMIALFIYRTVNLPRFGSGGRGKQARLAITDAAAVDQRRRLVLIRRDDVEHLVMIGGPADVVIESNIRRNAPARPLDVRSRPPAPQQNQPSAAPASAPADPAEPAPTPAAVGGDEHKGSLLSRIREGVAPNKKDESEARHLQSQPQPVPPSRPFLAPATPPAAQPAAQPQPATRPLPASNGTTARADTTGAERKPALVSQATPAQDRPSPKPAEQGGTASAPVFNENGTPASRAERTESRSSVVEEMDALLNEISISR